MVAKGVETMGFIEGKMLLMTVFKLKKRKSVLNCSAGYLKDKGKDKNSPSRAAMPMALQSF